jgi:general secretion pathway protein D
MNKHLRRLIALSGFLVTTAAAEQSAPVAPVVAQNVVQVPGQPQPAAPETTTTAPSPTEAQSTPAQITAPAQPQAAPAAPAPKEIYLNFDNTELASFAEYIGELKKINIAYEKPLEGSKVSLSIREPLDIEGAWNVFLTVLDMAGFAMIQTGDYYKLISKDKKIQQPLPAFVNVPYDKLPDNDTTIRYVFFLNTLDVESVQPVLESMLSATNAIVGQKDMRAFIITDKASNIRAAAKLLQELDQMGLPEEIVVMQLKRVNAADAKTLLDALIRKPEGNPLARLLGKASEGNAEYFSPTTRVIAEERTNKLILLGNSKSIAKVVSFITEYLDTELKNTSSPLHIYELQNIDAKQVMDILKEVTATPDSTTGQAAGKYGSIRGGVKYFGPMSFQVDKDGNRLIVSCVNKQDWELLKKTLDDLDKPQPQIALESLIVTVALVDTKGLGGALRSKTPSQFGHNINFQSSALTDSPSLNPPAGGQPTDILGNMLTQIASAQGQSILTFGPSTSIWGVFNAIKTMTNSSIISQPFMTIANKTAATITIGQVRRVVASTQPAQGTTPEVKGFKDAEANTNLTVTPQINLDGIVRLQIDLEVTDFQDTAGNNTTTKKLKTNVSVADGQVLVLGGFVKTKVNETKSETPFFSKIPIVKWLFTNQNRVITKDYVFIFMSPTILKPRQAPGMQLYTKMKMHQATRDIESSIDTKRSVDPIHNWFFNSEKENYSHKVIDFANARYQPTTVDIKNDPYYRVQLDSTTANTMASGSALTQTNQAPAAPINQPQSALQQTQAPVQVAALPAEPVQPVQAAPQPEATTTPPPLPQLPTLPVDDTTQKQLQFKQLLETPPTAPATQQQQTVIQQGPAPAPAVQLQEQSVVIDTEKRNSLRDFLSANPVLAQRSTRNIGTRGRFFT